MKIQKAILRETWHIAAGVGIGAAIMCGIFAALGKFNTAVLFGALYSSFFAVLNFFLMGITVQKALDREDGHVRYVRTSYALRMILMVAAIIIGLRLLKFNIIATLVPFLLPKLVIYAMKLFGLYKPDKPSGKEAESP